MNKRIGFKKVIAGAIVAAAITLTSLPGGVVHADGGSLKSSGAPTSQAASGDVDGRDFLVWQRGNSPSSDRPTEEVAFYYNKIAFQYAATTDMR